MYISRQSSLGIAVQDRVGDLSKALDQLIPQSGHPDPVGLHVPAGLLQGRGHSHDARDILRARTLAPLLRAALNEGCKRNAFSGIQDAHTLGSVELVGRQREQVNVLLLHVNGKMARCLYRVCVEQDSMLLRNGADLLDGLNGSNLIIRKHDGN